MNGAWSAITCFYLLAAPVLSGCSPDRDAPKGMAPVLELPFSMGRGAGSQHGNYPAQTDGDMLGPDGERCVIFSWDRPLTKDLVLRLTSASCESKQGPGPMACTEISRTVIPLSDSTLKDEPGGSSPW